MQNSIKYWYQETYEEDTLGAEIKDINFKQLWDALCAAKDVYDVIGVTDSVIRERLFEQLAKTMNVDYNVVYYTWLGEYNKALLALAQ